MTAVNSAALQKRKRMKELLDNFLKSKGLYETFYQRVSENYEDCTGYNKAVYISIEQAFNWGEQPEGSDFWKNIRDEFENYINK